ncbi:hypothetical protein ScPMuIL_015504 [Solemya velum]
MMQCTKKLLKALVAIISVLFFAAGGALLGIGIWMIVDKIFISDIIGTQLFTAASYLLILSGCVLLVVSFVGCAGTFQENACIVISYFACLVFLFILILIAAILAVAFRADLEEHMKNAMRETIIENYGNDVMQNEDNRVKTAAWDDTQRRLQCCGVDDRSWSMYRQSVWFQEQLSRPKEEWKYVPESCCVYHELTHKYRNRNYCQTWQFGPPASRTTLEPIMILYFQRLGCYNAAKMFVTDQSVILVTIGFIFAVMLSVLPTLLPYSIFNILYPVPAVGTVTMFNIPYLVPVADIATMFNIPYSVLAVGTVTIINIPYSVPAVGTVTMFNIPYSVPVADIATMFNIHYSVLAADIVTMFNIPYSILAADIVTLFNI